MGRINQYPKANAINDSDTLLGVVGGTTKQVAKDVLLSGVTNDIDNTTIVGKKAGKVVTADDSSNNRLPEVTAYGKSVQKTYSGKNLLEIQAETPTTTTSGITFTINENKSISVSGISTGRATRQLGSFTLKAGSYILTQGYISKGNSVCIFLAYNDKNGTAKYIDLFTNTEGKVGFTLTTDTAVSASVDVRNANMTIPNVTLYPMIRDASITDDTYEPFVGGEPSPNPSFPQAITSVADDKSLVIKSVGKNWLEFDTNKNSYTVEGITFTIAEDNKITVNGTSTGYSDLFFRNRTNLMFLPKGKYIWSGCPSGGSESSYYMLLMSTKEDGTSKRVATDYGNGVTFTIEEDIYVYTIARVMKGTTVNNLVYAPMLRLATIEDDTYEPYISTEATLTLTDSMRGIEVTSGGNYTDEDGQDWICDTLHKYADGTGKLIRRVNNIILNGSEAWYEFTNTGGLFYQYYTNLTDSKDFSNVMCSHFTPIEITDRKTTTGIVKYNDQSVRIALQPAYGLDSISKWKEWLADNNITVLYALAEPIETDLTAEQMEELEKLMSFEPYTTVYTDDMGEVAITYFKNSDSGKIVGSLNDRISNLVALLQSNGVI